MRYPIGLKFGRLLNDDNHDLSVLFLVFYRPISRPRDHNVFLNPENFHSNLHVLEVDFRQLKILGSGVTKVRDAYRGSPPYRPDGISSARRNFRKFCKKNRHINRFDALIFIKLWAMLVNSEHFLNVSTQNMRVGELKNILQTQRNVKA